jgi:hypothetical protein
MKKTKHIPWQKVTINCLIFGRGWRMLRTWTRGEGRGRRGIEGMGWRRKMAKTLENVENLALNGW